MSTAPFITYFNADINETIHTPEEHGWVTEVLGMDRAQLEKMKKRMNLRATMYPSFKNSRECRLRSKAGILRIHQLDESGALLPKSNLVNILFDMMIGYIIGDEFTRRWERNAW